MRVQSSGCDATYIGNGICDLNCNTALCFNDGGDCVLKPQLNCPVDPANPYMECGGRGDCVQNWNQGATSSSRTSALACRASATLRVPDVCWCAGGAYQCSCYCQSTSPYCADCQAPYEKFCSANPAHEVYCPFDVTHILVDQTMQLQSWNGVLASGGNALVGCCCCCCCCCLRSW